MKRVIIFLTVIFFLPIMASAQQNTVDVYYFYSNACPHSADMTPFLEDLHLQNPKINLRKFEVTENEMNLQLYQIMTYAYGNPFLKDVPLTYIGNQYVEGYDPEKAQALIEYCLITECVSPFEKLQEFQKQAQQNPELLKQQKEWKKIIFGWIAIILILVIFIWATYKFFKYIHKKAKKIIEN